MWSNLFILAAGDDDLSKVIGAVIMIGIAIIAAITNALQKQRQKTEQQWQETLAKLPPRQPSAGPPATPLPLPRPQGRPASPAPRPLPRPASQRRPLPPRLPVMAPKRTVAAPQRPGMAPQRPAMVPKRLPPRTAQRPIEPPPLVLTADVIEKIAPAADLSARQISAAPTASHAHPRSSAAQAAVAFLRPQTLRSQFILTEILQPPLALRQSER